MASTSSPTEAKTYNAQCHCGAIKFTVDLPPLETGATKVNNCNCSICTKKGYLLVYPEKSDVRFISGEEKMAEYKFGKKTKPHTFCPACGTSLFIDFGPVGRDNLAISVRVLEGIEDIFDKLVYTTFDGKRLLGPQYCTQS